MLAALAMLERVPEAEEAVEELLNRQAGVHRSHFAVQLQLISTRCPSTWSAILEGIRRAGIPE